MRLPAPMRVGPWICAAAPTSVPGTDRPPAAPITAKGPTRTPSASSAVGSITAVGWMSVVMIEVGARRLPA